MKSLAQKARGLCELAELNIRVPHFFIVPNNCFLTYNKMSSDEKKVYVKNIICSFEEYIAEISEDEALVNMYSLRCPDKTLNNKIFPFPETVLNIGYNRKIMQDLNEYYGDEFCKKAEDVFIKHAKRFVEYVGADDNIPLVQLNAREQLEYFVYNLYQYFEKIYDNSKDINCAFILQRMVYGNVGERSLTGMCYTRNPYTGEEMDYGRYIINRQGISLGAVESKDQLDLSMLKKCDAEIYDELKAIMRKIEDYYNEIRYLEYTVQNGKVYILQNTVGNRTFILPPK